MQTKWTYAVIKANASNHDSGLCNGLQGPLHKAGRLPKDLFKDWTTAIIGDIRISKFWGFVWFVGWGFLVFLVLPALLCGKPGNFWRYRETVGCMITSYQKLQNWKAAKKQPTRTYKNKAQGQDQNFNLCPWALCVTWSLRSLQLSHWRTFKALCIFCYMKERFSVLLSVWARRTSYICLILANKQRWKMAVAQMCLRVNIGK